MCRTSDCFSIFSFRKRIISEIVPFQFGRWSFLAVGVLYGAYHQSRLSKREVGIREIENKQKVIRDAKLAEEKKRSAAGK